MTIKLHQGSHTAGKLVEVAGYKTALKKSITLLCSNDKQTKK